MSSQEFYKILGSSHEIFLQICTWKETSCPNCTLFFLLWSSFIDFQLTWKLCRRLNHIVMHYTTFSIRLIMTDVCGTKLCYDKNNFLTSKSQVANCQINFLVRKLKENNQILVCWPIIFLSCLSDDQQSSFSLKANHNLVCLIPLQLMHLLRNIKTSRLAFVFMKNANLLHLTAVWKLTKIYDKTTLNLGHSHKIPCKSWGTRFPEGYSVAP